MPGKTLSKAVLSLLMVLAFSALVPAQASKQQAERIRVAVPDKARVTPKKPRRVLIWNTPFMDQSPHKGYTIPQAEYAMKLLGEKTGAFLRLVPGRSTLWRYDYLPEWGWYIMVEGHWYDD